MSGLGDERFEYGAYDDGPATERVRVQAVRPGDRAEIRGRTVMSAAHRSYPAVTKVEPVTTAGRVVGYRVFLDHPRRSFLCTTRAQVTIVKRAPEAKR
jgi:hypothetical protein